ncbi:MAG: malto-oligosyltrehalose synthase, partial [Chloroflexi bacterium]|nr:malto-oligosyltrehalose synthase [Chloroflexota bacterium]
MTFDHARELLPYLQQLGISDLYTSPLFSALPGSSHGYDVIDPTRFNPELGGADGFAALATQLKRLSMGLLLDIVPNHMVAGSQNTWWADVLEHGRDSQWAAFFDIDWSAGGKIVLAVLGRTLSEVLAAGELQVEPHGDRSWLRYHDRRFPLRSGTDTSSIDEALSQQHYVLAHWRDGMDQLNYRRFFDVDGLAGVRQEDERVFDATHALVRRLADEGSFSGLRIDHIDGLYEPAAYLERLAAIAPDAYLLVEKVLADDEALPESWPVEGTTGYEFLNAVNSLFVDPDGLEALQNTYVQFTGRSQSFADVVFDAKRQVARELFPAELARLARDLSTLAEQLVQDAGEDDLKDAIGAVAAAFPVYRTYVAGFTVSERDRDVVERAIGAARQRTGPSTAIDLLKRVLLL